MKTIPKIETIPFTIKQEMLTYPKYVYEDNKSQGYEAHDRLKVKKGRQNKEKKGMVVQNVKSISVSQLI